MQKTKNSDTLIVFYIFSFVFTFNCVKIGNRFVIKLNAKKPVYIDDKILLKSVFLDGNNTSLKAKFLASYYHVS